MLKILFINAIDYTQEVETRYPSLGLGYLAAVLYQKFGREKILIKIVDREVGKELNVFKPDVVGISAISQNYQVAKKYAKMAKRMGAVVIIGGYHVSLLPATLTPSMDIGVLFEGEETIQEIIELYLKSKDGFDPKKLQKIKGIVYWASGRLVKTETRPLIKNLDILPFPERGLLAIDKHTYMFTSRGCPYRCVFCASSRYWQQVRFFSAEYVVDEIKQILKDYPYVSLISFYDDLFILDEERLEKIVSLIKKNGLDQRLKFSCSCRANLLSEGTVRLLKKMNIVSVGLGLESGNERVLNYLKGSAVTIKDNYKAIKLLKKYKIAANASFIIGSPDETEKEMMDTYNFIKKSQLDFFEIYALTPLPGTPVWDQARKRKLVRQESDWDWSRLNINFDRNYNKAIVVSKTVSRKQLFQIYTKFRRLKTYLMIRNIWFHPHLLDRPQYLIAIFWRSLKKFFGSSIGFGD